MEEIGRWGGTFQCVTGVEEKACKVYRRELLERSWRKGINDFH